MELIKEVINSLKQNGAEAILQKDTATILGVEGGIPLKDMTADALLVFGGDGTILQAVIERDDIPVLGVNFGEEGFLAEVQPEDTLAAVTALLKGNYKIEQVPKLTVDIDGRFCLDALNDVAIFPLVLGRIIHFSVKVDGNLLEEIKGDGVVVATPLGSPSYALSAGGAIIVPGVKAYIIAPICAFKRRAFPIVVPDDCVIEIETVRPRRKLVAIVDGQIREEVREGEVIKVYKSKRTAKFIKLHEDFYDKLRAFISRP
jgi:NAD+ kinase